MTHPLPILVDLAVTLALGVSIVTFLGLRLRRDLLAGIGYAWVAGSLGTGLALALLLAFSAPLSAVLLNAVLLSMTGVLAFVAARRARRDFAAPSHDMTAWDEAPPWQRAVFASVVAALLAFTLDRAVLANRIPVVRGDEALIWASRAKMAFHAGGLNAAFRREVEETLPGMAEVAVHEDYPALNSLLQLACYVDAGRITQVENRIPIQAFAFATILIVGACLRRVANPLVAAMLLVLLVSQTGTRETVTLGCSDGMVGLGLACALDCLLREVRSGHPAWARLGGLSLGFLAWSKHEGATLAAIFAVTLLVSSRQVRVAAGIRSSIPRLAWWFIPTIVFAALTWTTNAAFGFKNDLVQSGPGESTIWTGLPSLLGSRTPDVLARFWRDFLAAPCASRLLVFPMLIGLPIVAVRAQHAVLAAAGTVLAALLVDLAVFVATPRDLDWHWSTAGVRVLSQLNPAIVLVVGAMSKTVTSRLR